MTLGNVNILWPLNADKSSACGRCLRSIGMALKITSWMASGQSCLAVCDWLNLPTWLFTSFTFEPTFNILKVIWKDKCPQGYARKVYIFLSIPTTTLVTLTDWVSHSNIPSKTTNRASFIFLYPGIFLSCQP